MSCAFNALRSAVIEAAKADAGVAAICAGRIYEEVPRDDRDQRNDAKAPYVYLAYFAWRDVEAGCGPLYAVTMHLHAVSTKFGREESRELASALKSAFDRKTLPLAGGHAMTIFKAASGGDVKSYEDPKEAYLELRCELADANGYPTP